MEQKANSFDRATLEKIGRGFLIALGGAIFSGFIVLAPEVTDYLRSQNPIDWSLVLLTSWGSLSSALINAGREYMKGV